MPEGAAIPFRVSVVAGPPPTVIKIGIALPRVVTAENWFTETVGAGGGGVVGLVVVVVVGAAAIVTGRLAVAVAAMVDDPGA